MDISPDCHDGITDKLIQRAAVFENHNGHFGEILIQHPNELFRVRLFGDRGKPDYV